MIPDLQTALIEARRKNIARYARLLATELTELEREFIHKRLAAEQSELERTIAGTVGLPTSA